jgi:hypothetical protein
MSVTRGIPVSEYLAKSTGEGKRFTCIRACRPFEDETSNWMADTVVRELRNDLHDIQIVDLHLSAYRILPYVSNDPNSKKFSPYDQFPIVLDAIKNADGLLVSFYETVGFPDPHIAQLVNRFFESVHQEEGIRHGKPFGVVAHGGHAVLVAAASVALAFNHFGCNLVPQGILAWDRHVGNVHKDDDFGRMLSTLGKHIKDALTKE